MAKSKKPRKRYVPRRMPAPGHEWWNIMTPMGAGKLTAIAIEQHLSAIRIDEGTAKYEDFVICGAAFSVAIELAPLKIERGDEIVEILKPALKLNNQFAAQVLRRGSYDTPHTPRFNEWLTLAERVYSLCERWEIASAIKRLMAQRKGGDE